MLRLRRLKINKFRAVKPGVELTFNDGFNVLLGRNATGKTTLLELISMALRFDFSSIRDEDFDIEVEIDELLEGTSNSVIMQVGTRVDDTAPAMPLPGRRQRIPWVRALIRVASKAYRYEEDGGSLSLFEDETLLYTGKWLEPWGRLILFWACASILLGGRSQDVLPFWGSLHRGGACALRYDESLDRFNKDILSALTLPVFFSRTEKAITIIGELPPIFPNLIFAPPSLTELVRDRFGITPDAATQAFSSDALPFLGEFVRLCGFESAGLELSFLGKDVASDRPSTTSGDNRDAAVATFGEPRFLFTRKGGRTIIRHELLSYGQKRLLSLLYYLEASPHHLVADEMVNGLHHEWLEAIMEKIGDRQTFLSSQNPLLLDYMEFASADEVSRSFVLCELDDDDRLVWRNMSAEEAASFYSAYEVGIQHVGEILRTKDLW